tara:strand:+ start:3282 stop:3878 length:597 start_codon:yes stop_codon:yes gene_type:complete
MTKTDRVRVYYNIHKKCFSVQDYKTGLVKRHARNISLTNAMFVVRKSGNERVKSEGKKNVHAFVNGIVVNRYAKIDNEFCFPVRYNPYTMDYFHYQRDVNNKLVWLPVDKHWIGNVTLTIINVKPIIYADIDKLSDTKNDKSDDTKNDKSDDTKSSKEFGVTDLLNSQFLKSSKIGGEFLRRKIKILENKNKIKTIVI